MKLKLLMVVLGTGFLFSISPKLHADEVLMRNGDRYYGKVVSVTTNVVVFDSEMLGKISLLRGKVKHLAIGKSTIEPQSVTNSANIALSTNAAATSALKALTQTNLDLAAAFRSLGADTNFIGQIRNQMLGGTPEAASKYDQMVNDLLSGRLNMNDLRRQAQSSADQIRELKRELGPDASNSLDGYLDVLDQFLEETRSQPTNHAVAPKPTPTHKP